MNATNEHVNNLVKAAVRQYLLEQPGKAKDFQFKHDPWFNDFVEYVRDKVGVDEKDMLSGSYVLNTYFFDTKNEPNALFTTKKYYTLDALSQFTYYCDFADYLHNGGNVTRSNPLFDLSQVNTPVIKSSLTPYYGDFVDAENIWVFTKKPAELSAFQTEYLSHIVNLTVSTLCTWFMFGARQKRAPQRMYYFFPNVSFYDRDDEAASFKIVNTGVAFWKKIVALLHFKLNKYPILLNKLDSFLNENTADGKCLDIHCKVLKLLEFYNRPDKNNEESGWLRVFMPDVSVMQISNRTVFFKRESNNVAVYDHPLNYSNQLTKASPDDTAFWQHNNYKYIKGLFEIKDKKDKKLKLNEITFDAVKENSKTSHKLTGILSISEEELRKKESLKEKIAQLQSLVEEIEKERKEAGILV